jgi:S1-C subfamily serine protease
MDPGIVARVGAALAGDRVAEPPPTTRAITRGGPLTQLYWANVQNAPVAVVDGGTGSATVIIVHPNRQAYVLTNNHVAERAFTVKGRPPQVFLLFYDAALKNEIFDPDRFLGCFNSSHDQTAWCRAVRNSSRLATLVATDPTRDLALLSVDAVPPGVAGIPPADLQALQPGDQVAIIGSPKSLLWSLTTGIISAVRTNFTLGTGSGTMIQTQAPLNPGNSGGPLFAPNGNLAGVVFAGQTGEKILIGNQQISVPAEGLNYAIGIDQVLAFTRSHLAKP